MRVRAWTVVLVAAMSSAAPAASYPKGDESQQTHPRVSPRQGHRHTAFAVRFTLASAPGNQGVVATSYRLEIRAPKRAARCQSAPPPEVGTGAQGARVRVPLNTPRRGWCRGRYTVIVLLQRGPYCKDGYQCPLFATQDLDVGRARFTITPVARTMSREERPTITP